MSKGELITLAAGALTTIGGWFVGRRSRVAKAAVSELEATERAIEIWRTLAQDLKKEVDELREIVDDLRQQNETLKKEVSALTIKLK